MTMLKPNFSFSGSGAFKTAKKSKVGAVKQKMKKAAKKYNVRKIKSPY